MAKYFDIKLDAAKCLRDYEHRWKHTVLYRMKHARSSASLVISEILATNGIEIGAREPSSSGFKEGEESACVFPCPASKIAPSN